MTVIPPAGWHKGLWPCKCGAWNRLRDTTCRHCGDPKPEAEND